MTFVRVLFVLALLAVVGCGSQPAPIAVTPVETSPADTARAVLEGIAESGEVGSGVDELRTALEELKQTDAAKADALLTDLSALEAASGEAAKAKANEMLGKL